MQVNDTKEWTYIELCHYRALIVAAMAKGLPLAEAENEALRRMYAEERKTDAKD